MEAYFRLEPEAVFVDDADGKKAILQRLAQRFASVYDLDAVIVQEALEEREALGSTGFGRGVAIPHARIDGLGCPVVALMRLDSPVEFDAADGMAVDLVFGLLSPSNAGVSHLHALAAISRMARDDAMHQALTDANDAEALFSLLSTAIDRDAA